MSQIVEAFEDIVTATSLAVLPKIKAVDPNIISLNYQHGHYTEIHQTLQQFNGSREYYNKKYPLIALLEDVPARIINGIKEYRFSILICYSSKEDSKSQARYNEVIDPILMPIYEELISQIKNSGLFYGYEVPHDMIVRPYLGATGTYGTSGNIFSDILDCIELKNVRLKMYPADECSPQLIKK